RRAGPGPAAMLRAASRRLERLADPAKADQPEAPALALLAQAEDALAEAETLLARLAEEAKAEPRRLEATEERLFALRAAARKHGVAVVGLPNLQDELRARLATLESGAAEIAALEAAARTARTRFTNAAIKLSEARKAAALSLERAVDGELAPLRLDKARFAIALETLAEPQWGPGGAEAVRFLIATNPGEEPGALARVASGGELSRLMLALKVVLASASPVPTLVFDEVDSGIGGATAAAVGERLARVAERVQVLVLTHSPQVAARGEAHLRVSKTATRGRAATRVDRLASGGRREEIARMLAGETVTEAARAAAADLLGAMA
ncbi:MAG: DNA repair protein RecN, partial [Acetobacteraceae bacterium]|nr:DNA repair protein RecN [Acetobacteraceae bacterium]